MIVLCNGYSAKPLPSGQIELTIVAPQVDAISDKMSLDEIADRLQKSKKAIDKLSRRKKNPLPVVRGNGRPYGFRSQINTWLMQDGRFPLAMGDHQFIY